jgi:hypothetical protein
MFIDYPELMLSCGKTLLRGAALPRRRLSFIFLHTVSVAIKQTKHVLRVGKPLLGR